MITIADDLRAAAEAVVDLQRLRHGLHIGCAKCEEKWRFVTRLRQHADTIERVGGEMSDACTELQELSADDMHGWVEALRGDTT